MCKGLYVSRITQYTIHNSKYTKGAESMESLAIVKQNNALAAQQTVGAELFTRWTEYIGDRSKKTVETYTRAIKQFFNYITANEIGQPQRADIIAYKEELAAEHKPTTVQAYIMAVKLFFQWTAAEGLYPNVAERVTGAKLDKEHKRDYLSLDEAKELLDTVDRSSERGKRNYAILLCMLVGGLRTAEITRANIEDLQRKNGGDILYIQGKGHTERTSYIKLPSPVKKAIAEYLEARADNSEDAQGKVPLFASVAHRNGGERMTTKSISRLTKEALIAAGMDSDKLTAHSLRHTCAVLNLMNGGTLTETQTLLRHTSSDTTRIYTHDIEREKNNSEARVAAAIFS